MSQKIKKPYLNLSKAATVTYIMLGLLGLILILWITKYDSLSIYNSGGGKACTRVDNYEYSEFESYKSPQLIASRYTWTLDGLRDTDNYLCVYSKYSYIDVYIDGVLRHSMQASEDNIYGHSIVGYWSSIPLTGNDAGVTVQVTFYPIYEDSDADEFKAYVGASTEIYRELLLTDAPTLFVTILMIFAGLTFVCLAFIRSLGKRHRRGLIFLGMYGVFLGTWGFTYTDFGILLLHKWILILTAVNSVCLLLSVVTFVWMMKYQMDEGKQKMLNMIATVAATVYSVILILQLANVMDVHNCENIIYVIMLLAKIMVIMIIYIEAIQNKKNVTQRRIAFCLLPCLAGLILDIVMHVSVGGLRIPLFFMSTVSIYLITFGVNIIRDAEEALVGRIKYVEQVNGTKDDALLRLSEELRTPMNDIDNLLSQLKKDVRHPERVLHYISQIEESNDRMLERINAVINETNEENLPLNVEERAFDLRQLVTQTMQIYALECKHKQLVFDIDCNMTHAFFMGYAVHLKKLLSHIMVDAIQKAPVNGEIHLNVDLGVMLNEKKIVKFSIYVANDKEGYDLPAIEPLVDILKGQIYMDSTKGEGVLLIVEVPLIQLCDELMD